MTIESFMIRASTFLVFFPAAVLCLLPMKNQFKKSLKSMIMLTCALFGITIPLLTFICLAFELVSNDIMIPALVIYFVLYAFSLKTPIIKSLSIFLYVCAYMWIIAVMAHGLNALYFIELEDGVSLLSYALFQFGCAIVLLLLMFYPFMKYGSELIDSLALKKVWYITIPISLLIILLCARIAPRKYETLYVNNVYKVLWALVFGMLFLLMFLSVIFYFIVNELQEHMDMENRTHILEVQENLFNRTQKYLDETARTRHDFKQTLYTLKSLADDKDYDAINEYLDEYIKNLPQSDIVIYCKNRPLNALLNHYAAMAKENKIPLKISVDIQEDIEVSDVDLCNISGNILDNAITASKKADLSERFIRLIISQNHNSHIYIIAENSYAGKLKNKNGRYLTTSRKGNGIGLASIIQTANRYGGEARFYNDEKKFYSEVML